MCCDASDDVGIACVRFYVWTERDGKDDVISYDAFLEGNPAWCYIDSVNHGNELGNYIIEAYVFDGQVIVYPPKPA